MDTIYHVTISDPPTQYIVVNKRKKRDKEGKIIKDKVHYLTANIFYSGVHWQTQSIIVNFAKDWIMWFLKEMPKIQKCNIEITYHHPTDTFDLDNKCYFWIKIILDLMKTPTSTQILKALEYNNPIKTIRTLPDDTVRFVDGINMRYKKGAPAIEIKINGRKQEEQTQLF